MRKALALLACASCGVAACTDFADANKRLDASATSDTAGISRDVASDGAVDSGDVAGFDGVNSETGSNLAMNGVGCTQNNQCLSSFCVDGVCCDRACTGSCEACDLAPAGKCVPVAGEPRRNSACGTGVCRGQCDGQGATCQFPATSCGTARCVGNVLDRPGTCSQGVCLTGGTQDCGTYACSIRLGSCLTSCSTSADCATDHFCSGTKCISRVLGGVAGFLHTCVVHADGRVSCWGKNDSGQLGLGPPALAESLSPTLVPSLNGIKSVVGGDHTCALTDQGPVYCWGYGNDGNLGVGTTANSLTPVQVRLDGSTFLSAVQKLHSGIDHICAIGSNTWCWGSNFGFASGGPAAERKRLFASPVPNVGAPAVFAANNSANIYVSGTKICGWGYDDSGLLADQSSQMLEPSSCRDDPQAANLIQFAFGRSHLCTLSSIGAVTCWGTNDFGQMGNGDLAGAPVSFPGKAVPNLGKVTKIAAGSHHTCALSDGTVRCWGRSTWGAIGDGIGDDARRMPSPASDLSEVVDIFGGVGSDRMCAIRRDGSLWCWGRNLNGELGTGDKADAFKPVPVRW